MTSKSMEEKIAAILRKAASTNNPEEASIFMKKARELMEKHQINLADLPAEERAKSDPMGTNSTPLYQPGSPAETKHWLMGQTAHFYGCYVVVVPSEIRNAKGIWVDRAYINYHGPVSARSTTQAMFPFIWEQILRMAREHSRGSKGVQRKLQRDISRALSKRLHRILAERTAKPEEVAEPRIPSTALVILENIQKETEEFAVGQYKDGLKEGKTRNFKAQSCLARELAERVVFDHQVEGGKEGKRHLA